MGSKLPCLFVKLIWCTGATDDPSRGIGHHSVLETNHLNNWLVPFGFLPSLLWICLILNAMQQTVVLDDASMRTTSCSLGKHNLIHIVLPAFLRFKFAVA